MALLKQTSGLLYVSNQTTLKVLLVHKKVSDLLFGQTHGLDLLSNPYCRYQEQRRQAADASSVNCKWVLKNWRRHLGSASHPSQTNEAPAASK